MRKYFWGFGFCGAVLVAGAAFTAHHAARHPHSFVGRVMHGANYAASRMTPAAGFGPVLSSLKKQEVASTEVCGVPADPEPIEEPSAIQPVAHSSAPIVIPEEEKPTAVAQTPANFGPFGPAIEPSTSVAQAPAKMPLCDEEECETLPMPLIEEVDGEEEQEAGSSGGGASGLFRLFFQMPKLPAVPMGEVVPMPTEAEMPKTEEVQANPYHHHHHYSGCPHTGRMYRDCPVGCPGPKSVAEEPKQTPNGAEEASEEGTSKEIEKSALGKIRKFKKRQSVDDGCPTHPGVDTMEMRPSDRQLYEYGPGGM